MLNSRRRRSTSAMLSRKRAPVAPASRRLFSVALRAFENRRRNRLKRLYAARDWFLLYRCAQAAVISFSARRSTLPEPIDRLVELWWRRYPFPRQASHTPRGPAPGNSPLHAPHLHSPWRPPPRGSLFPRSNQRGLYCWFVPVSVSPTEDRSVRHKPGKGNAVRDVARHAMDFPPEEPRVAAMLLKPAHFIWPSAPWLYPSFLSSDTRKPSPHELATCPRPIYSHSTINIVL